MELDAAQIDDPGQPRCIIDDQLFRRTAGGKGKRGSSQPSWAVGWRALLIKCFTFGAVDKPFENDRPIHNSGESAGRDRQIVAHDVEFRELRLFRKIWLVRVRYPDFVALNREQFGGFFLGHYNSLHRLRG